MGTVVITGGSRGIGAATARLFAQNGWTVGINYNASEQAAQELASYLPRMNKYGLPLDSRSDYTKSDWLVWTATLCRDQADFERFIDPLWNAYNFTKHRVPMTDWYDTITAEHYHFQNRTVQGGLFIKMLEASGILTL